MGHNMNYAICDYAADLILPGRMVHTSFDKDPRAVCMVYFDDDQGELVADPSGFGLVVQKRQHKIYDWQWQYNEDEEKYELVYDKQSHPKVPSHIWSYVPHKADNWKPPLSKEGCGYLVPESVWEHKSSGEKVFIVNESQYSNVGLGHFDLTIVSSCSSAIEKFAEDWDLEIENLEAEKVVHCWF